MTFFTKYHFAITKTRFKKSLPPNLTADSAKKAGRVFYNKNPRTLWFFSVPAGTCRKKVGLDKASEILRTRECAQKAS